MARTYRPKRPRSKGARKNPRSYGAAGGWMDEFRVTHSAPITLTGAAEIVPENVVRKFGPQYVQRFMDQPHADVHARTRARGAWDANERETYAAYHALAAAAKAWEQGRRDVMPDVDLQSWVVKANPRRKLTRGNPTMSEEQASTLLRQLGGTGRLGAMIGAKNFMRTSELDGTPALSFRFSGSPTANYARVALDASDTYALTLGKVRKYDLTVVARSEGLHADQLRPAFERATGLYLSLGTMGRQNPRKNPTSREFATRYSPGTVIRLFNRHGDIGTWRTDGSLLRAVEVPNTPTGMTFKEWLNFVWVRRGNSLPADMSSFLMRAEVVTKPNPRTRGKGSRGGYLAAPRGYKAVGQDSFGYPRFMRGEPGKPGCLIVSRECRATGFNEPDRCGWRRFVWQPDQWGWNLDDSGFYDTPAEAATAGKAEKAKRSNPRAVARRSVRG